MSSGLSALMVLCVWAPVGQFFSNQTDALGITFRHHTLVGDEIFLGAGAAWGDYDSDGYPDLYVADQDGPNHLYHNLGPNGGFAFEEVGGQLGVQADGTQNFGAVWGDYDNDGDKDLYVLIRGNNIMYRNDGPGGPGGWLFTDVTDELGAHGFGRTSSAVYGDYDNDGWPDLYVGNHHYEFEYPVVPESEFHKDYLYHNVPAPDGSRVFVNVADELFTNLETSVAHSAGFFDFDNDDDLDLYVVNEDFYIPGMTSTRLWRNNGFVNQDVFSYSNVTPTTNTGLLSHPMGLAVGDYNNDGWFDFAMSDLGPNHLYKNLGGTFEDVAEFAGVQRELVPGTDNKSQFGWGITFLDYDLDGFEDLYVATGTSANSAQPNPLFRNNGNPPDTTFTDVTDISGANDSSSARSVVKADFDRDGDEDLFVVNYGGTEAGPVVGGIEPAFLRNDQAGNHFLALQLVGTVSNRDAIGARVRVAVDGAPDQYRMVQSGSTTNGSHDLSLVIGLGSATQAQEIVIDWPSGVQNVLTNVAADQYVTVTEEVILTTTALSLTGPTVVAAGSLAEYQARATLSDGSELLITEQAQWSAAPPDVCSIVAPGLLATLELAPGQTESVQVTALYEGLEAILDVEVADATTVDLSGPIMLATLPGGATTLETNLPYILIQGTASDASGIFQVVWSNDQGGAGPCSGTTNWSTGSIALVEGTNLITITATDSLGNEGFLQLDVVYVNPAALQNENQSTPANENDNFYLDPWGNYSTLNDNDNSTGQDNLTDNVPTVDENSSGPAVNDDQAANENVAQNDESNGFTTGGGPNRAGPCGMLGVLSLGACAAALMGLRRISAG